MDVPISFQSREHGRYQDRVELVFRDVAHEQRFVIIRSLTAIVGSQEDYEVLKPVAPYVPKKQKHRAPVGAIEEGVKPPALAEIDWVVPLKQYPMNNQLQRVLEMDDLREKLRLVRSFLPRDFEVRTYGRRKSLIRFHVTVFLTDTCRLCHVVAYRGASRDVSHLYFQIHLSSILGSLELQRYDNEGVTLIPSLHENLY